ncbi:hypothetical protein AHMF7605_22850 [Adhaeribacter arboris]|uniref:Uncharacterized protein n=1 Tax=Adhaeribacter arboris TaxID=2072846 RepID=A0A2T2YKV7_9BACT|nr:hypothetical protein [Adhaeribacter arboris]PSR56138.1 hypothetical protein AHMF7605_22850 [Adhaeribacter arboris]
MKNLFSFLLLLAVFTFSGCKKDEEVNPDEESAKVDLGVFKITQDPATGKAVKAPITCTIWMWRTENRDYDIAASGSEIYVGRIFDKTTKTYVSAEYGAIGVVMTEKIKPGKYLVYVVINKSDLPGSQAYSYKNVEIGADQTLNFKKVFSQNVGTMQFEDWEKNQ